MNKTLSVRRKKEKSRSKKRVTTRSYNSKKRASPKTIKREITPKIVLTKRTYDSNKRPTPETLKIGEYYIIRSQNPNLNIKGKFQKYIQYDNKKNAVFLSDIIRQKIDEDTGTFYSEEETVQYSIPTTNIFYIEKISDPINYYKVHNLPEDLQREVDSYL